ncbi:MULTISPECIES: DUF397 domain-containing protein [Streptomyces]|uniref:DUF397 domain-containing protein n=1 Tax=Streptomyces TaxID=1883 RepID=UPI000241AA7F|nr:MULTISPECIES: DUF397 domain-containing protein [Streptomyces]EHM29265.1 hypothetical protein SPW_2387 [Streptomyces sp. W007]WTD26208.1 DUF397 domain-containing protein [Streptomyces anulatus]
MSTELKWFKSSYSGENSGNCIEVATCPHTVHIRDSKDLTVPALAVSPTSWTSFVEFTAS